MTVVAVVRRRRTPTPRAVREQVDAPEAAIDPVAVAGAAVPKAPKRRARGSHSLSRKREGERKGQEVPPYTKPRTKEPIAQGFIAIPSIRPRQRPEEGDTTSSKATSSQRPPRARSSTPWLFELGGHRRAVQVLGLS